MLTGAQSGEFTLWNGLAFNFETILQAHDTPIRSICWSHSSRYLISSEDSGQIKYFQSNMNNLAALPGHAGHSCRALSFSQSDEKFVSVGDDGYVRIWDFEQRREERAWRGHGQDVRCVDWHPSKGLIVSGSTDDKVSFWDPRSGQALASYVSLTFSLHSKSAQGLPPSSTLALQISAQEFGSLGAVEPERQFGRDR